MCNTYFYWAKGQFSIFELPNKIGRLFRSRLGTPWLQVWQVISDKTPLMAFWASSSRSKTMSAVPRLRPTPSWCNAEKRMLPWSAKSSWISAPVTLAAKLDTRILLVGTHTASLGGGAKGGG